MENMFVELQNVLYEMRKLKKKLNNFKIDMNNLKAVYQNVSVVDTVKNQHIKICKLESKLINIDERLLKLEYYSKLNNVIIKGIPYDPKENLYEIFYKFMTRLGINIDLSEINTIHRICVNQYCKPILLKLNNTRSKYNLIGASRKMLTTADHLGFEIKSKVYVHEHLIKHNQKLFETLICLRNTGILANVWTMYGKVWIREYSNSTPIHIKNMPQIKDLLKSYFIDINADSEKKE